MTKECYLTDNEKVARSRQGFVKWALRKGWPIEKAKMVAVRKFPYTLHGDILNVLNPRFGLHDTEGNKKF